MKTNVSYLVTDLRDIDVTLKMAPVAYIAQVPGGVGVMALNARGYTLNLENADDDDGSEILLEDNEETGRVIIHAEEGSIVLDVLDLDNWRKNVRPVYGDGGQVFSRDSEVNAYYYQRLLGME